jgi:hypothetical protein
MRETQRAFVDSLLHVIGAAALIGALLTAVYEFQYGVGSGILSRDGILRTVVHLFSFNGRGLIFLSLIGVFLLAWLLRPSPSVDRWRLG